MVGGIRRVPTGKMASGEGLADSRSTVTEPDMSIVATRLAELGETAIFFGLDEGYGG
jgi:hypothetical protein